MTTAQSAPSNPRDMTGQVLTEAARRMVPVLASKLMTALADQAVAKVEQLADRLDDYREHGPAARGEDPDEGGSTSMAGTALAFLADQVRTALAVLARLIAQAADMLRRATERLHARRAPEGIEAEQEDLDDEWDEDDDEYDADAEVDEDLAEPAMAGR